LIFRPNFRGRIRTEVARSPSLEETADLDSRGKVESRGLGRREEGPAPMTVFAGVPVALVVALLLVVLETLDSGSVRFPET